MSLLLVLFALIGFIGTFVAMGKAFKRKVKPALTSNNTYKNSKQRYKERYTPYTLEEQRGQLLSSVSNFNPPTAVTNHGSVVTVTKQIQEEEEKTENVDSPKTNEEEAEGMDDYLASLLNSESEQNHIGDYDNVPLNEADLSSLLEDDPFNPEVVAAAAPTIVKKVGPAKTSFPTDKDGMKNIPTLDFSWRPITTAEDIAKLTAEHWHEEELSADLASIEESLLNEPPVEKEDTMNFEYFEATHEIPSKVSPDFFKQEEESWWVQAASTETLLYSDAKIEEDFENLSKNSDEIADRESAEQKNQAESTNDNGVSEVKESWTVKVIGEEGDYIHVEKNGERKWIEVKINYLFKRGNWYKVDVKISNESNYPACLGATVLEQNNESFDYALGDDLHRIELEDKGLSAHCS